MTSSSPCAFDGSCRRGFEKVNVVFFWIIPNQSCICAKYSVVLRLATFILYVSLAHQATDWLFKEKKFLLKSIPYARILISSLMVPLLNSVVFYYKTTLWSCLSWTTCSHVCSRTSSCFGACYRSSSPENPATSSRRFVLQTFIFLPRLDESGISWHQPDLNLRQIWWLEHFPRTIILVPR